MDIKDWLFVGATVIAPLLAIQVSQLLDRRRQTHQEQLRLFKTLMATRSARLDPRHVEALNMIDVVFHSSTTGEIKIRSLWKAYLDHLGQKQLEQSVWNMKRLDLLIDLLFEMASFLGFTFDKTHIKNQTYSPRGYDELDDLQRNMRVAADEILSGKRALRISVEDDTSKK
jgi:hypothetical protein